jgi:hypothetical protein
VWDTKFQLAPTCHATKAGAAVILHLAHTGVQATGDLPEDMGNINKPIFP